MTSWCQIQKVVEPILLTGDCMVSAFLKALPTISGGIIFPFSLSGMHLIHVGVVYIKVCMQPLRRIHTVLLDLTG